MAISLRQLRYFLVLSEELHFGRAAARLNISQPPLSAGLRQLEDDLGVKLFDRDSRGTRLTTAGVEFSERVAQILGQLEAAQVAVTNVAKGPTGTLTVGFLPSMIFRHFSQVLQSFSAQNPDVRVEIDELNSSRQIDGLLRREIDVEFIHAMPLPDGLHWHTLERERFVCCLPRGHRLVTRARVSLRELGGEKLLIFSRRDAPHYHDHIASLFRDADLEPYDAFRLQHWFTTLALVAQGMGIAIVPQSLTRTNAVAADVAFVELEEEGAFHELQLVWRAHNLTDTKSPGAAFITHAKRFFLEFNPAR